MSEEWEISCLQVITYTGTARRFQEADGRVITLIGIE